MPKITTFLTFTDRAEEAVGRHQNEADVARRGFLQLAPDERQRLLAFLRSL